MTRARSTAFCMTRRTVPVGMPHRLSSYERASTTPRAERRRITHGPTRICSPNGIRTRVATLRGWCPRPLDDGAERRCAAHAQCSRRCSGGRTRTLNNWTRTSRVADYTTPDRVDIQISRAARGTGSPRDQGARARRLSPMRRFVLRGPPGTRAVRRSSTCPGGGQPRGRRLPGPAAAGLAALAVSACRRRRLRTVSVKVTPSRGLVDGQVVTVSGRGLARTYAGKPLTWFVTECTAAVRGA